MGMLFNAKKPRLGVLELPRTKKSFIFLNCFGLTYIKLANDRFFRGDYFVSGAFVSGAFVSGAFVS
ncbi:MAG: hypothetical protein WCJ06_15605, partial [Planctomycetota bacterium]